MDGVLVVDKPSGPTSHTVVARVRKALKVRRVGHTGTLDPLATGVLPLVVGRATRLSPFLTSATKEYVAEIRFGAGTATFDAEGRSTVDRATGTLIRLEPPDEPPGLSGEVVEEALRPFRGVFDQMPPPFSARKTGGVPAYKRARLNEPVERRPTPVVVHSLTLERYAGGLATVRLTCSAGFYVRSLAHDLGTRLGCGAYLESLRRTRAGDFTLEDAVPLETIEAARDAARQHVLPMERLLRDIPAVVLNERGVRRASHGNDVGAGDLKAAAQRPLREDDGERRQRWRLLDDSGMLVGIAEARTGGVLHPVVVLV